ncbi:hypothetical protein [Herbiconiux liangxiaofengii]|uniref:hypothetical protein n=1 Tax=Herbiconiux liangxiaofengii TaxID=3342795 RepID=UPI0035BAC805
MSGTSGGTEQGDEAVAARLARVLADTVAELQRTDARTEALARFDERRAILGFRRGPVMTPLGRVWRLGVLLLDGAGGLHGVGQVTRAVEPGRVTNQNPRAEERRDYRRAAFGRFAEGDTVNFDTRALALDAPALRAAASAVAAGDPEPLLALRGDTVEVRWNARPGAGGFTPLEPYLAERAGLLTAPPP